MPIRIRFWASIIERPERRGTLRKRAGRNQRILAAFFPAPLPAGEQTEEDQAGDDHKRGQREAEDHDRRVHRPGAFAPVAGLEHAHDHDRQPGVRESTPPTTSSRGRRPSAGGSSIQRSR